MRNAKAFTLVELLVALFIVGVVMTFVLTLHSGAMRVSADATFKTNAVATASSVINIFRRDVSGIFELPDYIDDTAPDDFRELGKYDGIPPRNYSLSRKHKQGSEIFWESPVNINDLSQGFRRMSFYSSVDGSRLRLTKEENGADVSYYPDSLAPYTHALITWAARSGTAFRQVGRISFKVSSTEVADWFPPTDETNEELQLVALEAHAFESNSGKFENIGSYRGVLYARTSTQSDTKNLELKIGEENIPAIIVIGIDTNGTAPAWVENNFEPLPEVISDESTNPIKYATPQLSVNVGSRIDDYKLYRKKCLDGKVTIGEITDTEGVPLLLIDPLFWSVGDEVVDIRFFPPPDFVDGTPEPDSDNIYASGIPPWIDVKVTVRYKKDDDTPEGLRTFSERIRIPTGRKP